MTIPTDGGKYNTGTTTNITADPSEKMTKSGEGSRLAKSDATTLQTAFYKSPLHGDNATYTPDGDDGVVAMKGKMQSMLVDAGDLGTVQGYWGFAAPVSDPEVASTGDLSYAGAPDVASVTEDYDANPVASPYMPNLAPPDGWANPDNADQVVVISAEPGGHSLPPFYGDGLANPFVTSQRIHDGSLSSGGSGEITSPDDSGSDGSE